MDVPADRLFSSPPRPPGSPGGADGHDDRTPPASAALVSAWAAAHAEVERLRTELAERTRERDASEARFHALVEGNADGIVVVDDTGTIRFANPTAATLFGIPREQLVDTPFGYPLVAGRTTEIDALSRGRAPVVMEMRVVDAEWEGRPACIACLRDITDRKRAEESARRLIRAEALNEAARETTRGYRFLADASAALASSLDHRTTLATLARLCVDGLADWAMAYLVEPDRTVQRLEVVHRDPALGEAAARLRDHPLEDGEANAVLHVLRTERPRASLRVDDAELAALTQDPGRRELLEALGVASYMVLPMRARDRSLGALALVRSDPARPFDDEDVALGLALASRAGLALDNARLYQSARAADRAKTDLIAVISHDLRTPLNSIIGYADLLDMGVGDPQGEQSRDFVRRIRSSAEHQVHLIDQLLTFSRIDAGAIELRPQEIRAADLLEELRSMVAPLADHAGLALSVHSEDGVTLRTDPDALRQIVLNLATNAVKYTERGEVRLEAERDGDGTMIRVSDTGIGISAEHLPRVFDPFWQADPGRRGTGLGLSIVRRLARTLGGDIEVASEPGRGSRFTLRLPADPPPPAPGP